MKEKLNKGFIAFRSPEAAGKSKYPNTFTFIITAKETDSGILQYIETECGNGERLFESVEKSNKQIEEVKSTFIKDGDWKIEDFYD